MSSNKKDAPEKRPEDKGATGRPRGTQTAAALAIRAQMEKITPNGEPVPVTLLRLGFAYHKQGLHAEAIAAIATAMKYAYPQLKQIEHTGTAAPSNVLVYVPDNGRGPKTDLPFG